MNYICKVESIVKNCLSFTLGFCHFSTQMSYSVCKYDQIFPFTALISPHHLVFFEQISNDITYYLENVNVGIVLRVLLYFLDSK